MIIFRYLFKEIFKMQSVILFILLIIFLSQKLIKILSNVVDGDVPINLIFPLLSLGIANMLQLILPLSLFLAIFFTLSKLFAESELVAMFACGLKKNFLYKLIATLSLITCTASLSNFIWFTPWSNAKELELKQENKINFNLAGLLSGQFQKIPNGHGVFYIGKIDNGDVKQIFMTQNLKNNNKPVITLADKGKIKVDDKGNQIIELELANRYEGAANVTDFRVSELNNYQTIIKHKAVDNSEFVISSDTDYMTIAELIKNGSNKALAELYWRISLLLAVPLMSFLVFPLCFSNTRQSKVNKFAPAIIMYLSYFLVQTSIRAQGIKGNLDPAIWFYITNGLTLLFILLINFADNEKLFKLKNFHRKKDMHKC